MWCREELRELFSLDTETACGTHDLLRENFPSVGDHIEDSCLKIVVDQVQDQRNLVSFIHLNPNASSQLTGQSEEDQVEK